MTQLSLPEIEGVKDLTQDAVQAGVTAIADVHIAMTQHTYDLLALAPPIAAPARAIGCFHLGLTHVIYTTIQAATWVASALADEAIRRQGQRAADRPV